MRLLPLLEMFCKWKLQDDCTNLRALMARFDSESDLQSTELGRSLLAMIQDDDDGLYNLPHLATIDSPVNPFSVVRERLASVDLAMRGLHPYVHSLMCLPCKAEITNFFCFCHSLCQYLLCVRVCRHQLFAQFRSILYKCSKSYQYIVSIPSTHARQRPHNQHLLLKFLHISPRQYIIFSELQSVCSFLKGLPSLLIKILYVPRLPKCTKSR